MKSYICFLMLLPSLSFAHCPYQVTIEGSDYCLAVTWGDGEKKVRGRFEPTEISSPYLVPRREIPQRWVYSVAFVSTWRKGDFSHTPVEIPNFRVFPYMHMQNDHHHSAGYSFFFDDTDQIYVFSQVAFQSMSGCWSLRWTTDSIDLQETSDFLMNLVEFSNLTEDEVSEQEVFCQSLNSDIGQIGHGHRH